MIVKSSFTALTIDFTISPSLTDFNWL